MSDIYLTLFWWFKNDLLMDKIYCMKTLRLALSGALLGAAIMGLMSNAQYLDTIGAVMGGGAVLIATARHFF